MSRFEVWGDLLPMNLLCSVRGTTEEEVREATSINNCFPAGVMTSQPHQRFPAKSRLESWRGLLSLNSLCSIRGSEEEEGASSMSPYSMSVCFLTRDDMTHYFWRWCGVGEDTSSYTTHFYPVWYLPNNDLVEPDRIEDLPHADVDARVEKQVAFAADDSLSFLSINRAAPPAILFSGVGR
jgi:hypothetical protein